jgi:hypothetical protein
MREHQTENLTGGPEPATHTIRVPRFLLSQEIGLGDIVKRITTSLGARPCAACEERAARLNGWLRFAPAEGTRGDLD